MAKGIPTTSSSNVAPIKARRLSRVPLARAAAFKAMQQREKEQTGEKYEVEQVKLSLDFDSGHIMRDENGEPVLDEHGNTQIHYINEGFVTLSGNPRAKLVTILKALGFDDERFIETEGKGAGGLTAEAAESVEAHFGVNGLGHDYHGKDWDELPFYTLPSKGGQESKRDVEVPILSLKILGFEVIGRHLDLALTIKNDWNRVESYMISEDPDPLTTEAPPAKSIPKGKETKVTPDRLSLDDDGEDTPLDPAPKEPPPEPEVSTKGQRYVLKQLKAAEADPELYVRIAHLISGYGPEDFTTLGEMPNEACQNFRDMVKADDTAIREAMKMAAEQRADEPPFDPDEEEDF